MGGQEIYVNVGGPAHNKRDGIKNNLENQNRGLEQSYSVKTSSYRVALILGLLCLLLLVGLLILLVVCRSKWEVEMMLLQTSYNNLTKEKDQLQTSYNNLTKEKDQLQTSYNNLTEEKDKLQTSYNNVTKEKDHLKISLDAITTDFERRLQALQPNEWKYFSGSFYYISSTEKTWQESRNDCLQKGADLVIINNHEEQELIRIWKIRTWIGLTDTEREGTWKWVDGTLLWPTGYWMKSEPNNANGNENCAEIYTKNEQNCWNDLHCDIKMKWICEIRLKN